MAKNNIQNKSTEQGSDKNEGNLGVLALAGVVVKVEEMGDNFFNAIGCDMDSVPYKETLEKLGSMEKVIADLYG